MLKYKFDESGKMSKIIVDPNKKFTFLDSSFKRQFNMSYGITEMLKLIIENSKFSDWQTSEGVTIEMSNEYFCKNKGYNESRQISTGFGDTASAASAAGGSKSRHKPARKTRRGRTRKYKSKSKTHRRRRHSHVRKHKKNTYTRRR
jgi:hypothetical protein